MHSGRWLSGPFEHLAARHVLDPRRSHPIGGRRPLHAVGRRHPSAFGPLPDVPHRLRAGPPFWRGLPGGVRPSRERRGWCADSVSGLHDGTGRVNRHRQHRRCGHGNRLWRARSALLDLGLRFRCDGDQVLRSRPWHDVSRGQGRPGSLRPHVLPAGRTAIAVPRVDLRVCRSRCGPDDDAVHAAELDGAGVELGLWHPASSPPASPLPC